MNEVGLRPVNLSDLSQFYEHQADEIAAALAQFVSRDLPTFTTHWQTILSDATVTARTVLCDEQVVGHLVSWGPPNDRLVGYWVGRAYWGRGIATRALQLFVADLSRPLGAWVAQRNVRSIRVLEKCGFVRQAERVDEQGVAEYFMRLV